VKTGNKKKAKQGQAQTTGERAYGAIRQIFKLSPLALAGIVFAILFVAFIAYSVFQPPPPKPSTSYYSEPLILASALQLLPGENYTYEINDPSLGIVTMQNEVKGRSDGCLVVETKAGENSIPFCLEEQTGEPRLPQGQDNRAGVGPQFFQPWMLALKDGWSWRTSANSTVEFMGASETIASSAVYRVAGRGPSRGREAFKVAIDVSVKRISDGKEYSHAETTQVVWIDAKKRVLLYAASGNSTIALVGAPFPLAP
jgi:hypothetical protein